MLQVRRVWPESDGRQDVPQAGDAPLQLQVRGAPDQPPRHDLQPSVPGVQELWVILRVPVPSPSIGSLVTASTSRDKESRTLQTGSVSQFWDDCVNM